MLAGLYEPKLTFALPWTVIVPGKFIPEKPERAAVELLNVKVLPVPVYVPDPDSVPFKITLPTEGDAPKGKLQSELTVLFPIIVVILTRLKVVLLQLDTPAPLKRIVPEL